MRALQLTEWKHEPEFREVPDPEPGPGEVVLRVAGAGVCHSDLHLIHDFESGTVPWAPPFTLGHENAGWVHALGSGVTGYEIGEPVAVYGPWGCGHCPRCRVGAENYCDNAATLPYAGGGLGGDGGMAPMLRIPQSRWLLRLRDLDPVVAAPLTDAALTPYHAIKRSLGRLVPGSTTLVIGAGGLGHMAVQILAALSATQIIVVDRREAALTMVEELGAHHTVLAGPDAAAEIAGWTRGRGTDLALDLVGVESSIQLAVASARADSDVTIIGIGGGPFVFNFFSQRYAVSLSTTYWGTLPELLEVIELAEAGKISAHVQLFPLDDALDAYRQLASGALTGRAVIVPN